MREDKTILDWSALIGIQPTADLIPKGLREVAMRVQTDSRETLFRVGDPVRHVYLVMSGEARLIRLERHGAEIILHRSRGGFIAEASLDSKTYHCDAVATEPSMLLLFPVVAFRAALANDHAFCKAWQSQLAKEVRKLRARCERLSLHSAVDRITHYIESEGDNGVVTLNESRKSWAAELGLSHEALYRALRRMQDDGTLSIDGDRFTCKT
jgi:CRP-like cAMP-binding protein